MAITNIVVTPAGDNFIFRWNTTITEADLSELRVDYGPDSNYGNSSGGSTEDPGPPLLASAFAFGPIDQPFHFRCVAVGFIGGTQESEDQLYPPEAETQEQPDRIIPIGGFAPSSSNDIVPGSTALSPYSNSPRFVSPDEFMNNILR